jgi:hypothetical protein
MGVAIRCILEQDVPGVPWMEGKSLAMACFADSGSEGGGDTGTNADIIAVDFGGGKPQIPSSPASSPAESLFAPLGPFIVGDGGVRWHDPAKEVVAVRSILGKLRRGAIAAPPDFDFPGFGYDDEEELTEGVRCDLEELEQILLAAQKAHTRFHLAFDV